METKVYNKEGKEAGKVSLPEAVFGLPFNANLVHQVVLALRSNARSNTAHTKDRSEVRGGGKKPWRQKGTGRARHGSRRSPIWTGGGVTFGPRNERNYLKKVSRTMRAKALAVTLSKKFADSEVLFMDALSFSEPKTAEARKVIEVLGGVKGYETLPQKEKNALLVLLPGRDEVVEKSFRNMGNVAILQVKDANIVDLLSYKYVVIVSPEESLKILEGRVGAEKKEVVKA